MTDSHSTRDRGSSARGASGGYPRREGLDRYLPTLAKPIRVASFWSAIVLPFLYVPFLLAGLSGSLETAIFLVLLCANALALYVGHSHRRSPADGR